jgi:UrcA family protein
MEVTTIKVPVSYADLDLSKTSDAAVLRTRIKATATDACKQLDALYPRLSDVNCVDNAVASATAQVEAAIAAAGR